MLWLYFLSINQLTKKHSIQAVALEDKVIGDIHRLYELIDSKSSSLLTHVSLMVTVCTFFVDDSEKNPVVKSLLLVEAFGYLTVALILLFCLGLSMYKAPSKLDDMRIYYVRSCRFRAAAYSVALFITKILTVMILFTIALKLCI